MNSLNNDKLDAILLLYSHVLAEKSAETLLSTDATDAEIPKFLYNRITSMIRYEHWKREYKDIISAAKRTAAVFMIICAISFALVMSVEAVREALRETLIEWYEEYIAVSFHSDEQAPGTIETKKEPTDIPSDWVRDVLIDSPSLFCIHYLAGEEIVLSYTQKILDDSEVWIDNEEPEMEEITVGEYTGILVKLNDKNSYYLLWTDDIYSYSLNGSSWTVNREMLTEIAESVE